MVECSLRASDIRVSYNRKRVRSPKNGSLGIAVSPQHLAVYEEEETADLTDQNGFARIILIRPDPSKSVKSAVSSGD
jgi:hypothetical protein